jgi:catechol 2,3-dioxygenase-like lactoylglutathione lyase family enzyme
VSPNTLDHVALWVEDRDRIADLAVSRLGMHVIERTDRFTLIGADARRFKLTLFEADEPREQGALKHIALRMPVLDGAASELDLGEGLSIRLVEAPAAAQADLDHVALFSADPDATADDYLRYGFEPAEPVDGVRRVEVNGAFVEFHAGDPGEPERPLLNHLAVLVDSADEQRVDAEEQGIEVADVVDAPNTYAIFVWLPENVKLEYVEHKPTFSLT